MKKVIIAGSHRIDGDTKQIVDQLQFYSNWDLIHLHEYLIGHFDYEHRNRMDDFLPLMEKIINHYDVLVFVTPVYWYAMSGMMKVFFDRITDLLTIEKDLGRKLRGKKMAVVSCSNGNHLGEHFWLPFEYSAKYLGMDYLGSLHTTVKETTSEDLRTFVQKIENKAN